MRRPKLSDDKKTELRENLDKHLALKAEEKKQFNKIFRKSPLFISSWIIRLVFHRGVYLIC